MLQNANLHVEESLFLSYPALQFSFPTFIGYQQPITSIIHHQKKQRLNPSGEEEGKGKWTKNEQKAYIEFLTNNKDEMSSKLSRKSQKVFLKMSFLVKTRTADQCRSHHQKILKYKGSIDEIIKNYQEDRGNYQLGSLQLSPKDKKTETQTGSADQVINQNQIYSVNRTGNHFRIVIREAQIACFLQ